MSNLNVIDFVSFSQYSVTEYVCTLSATSQGVRWHKYRLGRLCDRTVEHVWLDEFVFFVLRNMEIEGAGISFMDE